MDIKHLKTFSAVAQTGSFSYASKALGYAQPTVTTHIQLLEKEFNVRLFERLGHKIKLTPEGEKLLYYGENILKFSNEAAAALSAKGTVAGKITIGANESFSIARLPSILKQFIQKYPNVDVSLKFGAVKDIYKQMKENMIDVAFFLTPRICYPDLVVEPLVAEPIAVVTSVDHPFRSHTKVTISHLEDETLIITQKNCTYRAMIDELLSAAKVQTRSVIEINNVQAVKQLVMSGLGIAILPRIAVEYEITQNLLAEVPWEDPPPPVFTQIAYHKDKWLSPTLLNLLEQTRAGYCR